MFTVDQVVRIEEIKDLLKAHPNGMSFSDIYNKGKNFVEEKELSFCLSKTNKLGITYKSDGLYFLTQNPLAENSDIQAEASNPVTEEIRDLMKKANLPVDTITEPEVKEEVVKPTNMRLTEVEPITPEIVSIVPKAEKPELNSKVTGTLRGNFRRESVVGMIGFVFYRFRMYGSLTVNELKEIIDLQAASPSSIHQAYHKLKKDGFIEKTFSGYRWTGRFSYPFSVMLESDHAILKYTPDTFKERHLKVRKEEVAEDRSQLSENVQEKTTPILKVYSGSKETACGVLPKDCATTKTLDMIRERISCLTDELNSLKRMESLLTGT